MDGEHLALQQFECLTLGCTRLVAGSHLHCCSTCRHSSGALHTHRCNLALLRSTPFQPAGAGTGHHDAITQAPHHGPQANAVVEHASSQAPNLASAAFSQSSTEAMQQPVVQDLSGGLTVDPTETVSASASQHLTDQSPVHSGHTIFVSSEEEEDDTHDAEEVVALDLNDLD